MRLRKLSNLVFYIFVISLFTIPVLAFLRMDTSIPTTATILALSILIILEAIEELRQAKQQTRQNTS